MSGQLLTDEEMKKVILAAVGAKPQTEQQIYASIKCAEEMRANELILNGVLDGKLWMFQDGSETAFQKAIEDKNDN